MGRFRLTIRLRVNEIFLCLTILRHELKADNRVHSNVGLLL